MRHTCVTPSCDVSFRYITEVWKNNLEIYLLIHVEKKYKSKNSKPFWQRYNEIDIIFKNNLPLSHLWIRE